LFKPTIFIFIYNKPLDLDYTLNYSGILSENIRLYFLHLVTQAVKNKKNTPTTLIFADKRVGRVFGNTNCDCYITLREGVKRNGHEMTTSTY